jgi:hypothetical protein
MNYTKNHPIDIVLSKEQWALIHPGDEEDKKAGVGGGGVLCAMCVLLRASKLPKVINLTCRITFGKDYD